MDTWFTHSKRPRRLQGLSTRSVAFAFARRRHTRARPPATTLDRDVTHGVFVPCDAVSMTFASAMHAKLENERARSVATAACAACTVGFLFMRQRAIRGAIAKMLTVRGDSALCVVLVLVRARGMGSRTRERGR